MPTPEPDVAAVLLAAGRSERFGGDKLTSLFRGRPLWEWAARAAEEAGFRHRYLVVDERSRLPERDGWTSVVNPVADRGMGTSIAAGAAAAAGHRRIVVMLADMPLVAAGHLRRLALGSGTIFTRQADGSAGSPAGFGSECFAMLQSLTGDRGARSLPLPAVTVIAPPDADTLADIDTPVDLAHLAESKGD